MIRVAADFSAASCSRTSTVFRMHNFLLAYGAELLKMHRVALAHYCVRVNRMPGRNLRRGTGFWQKIKRADWAGKKIKGA